MRARAAVLLVALIGLGSAARAEDVAHADPALDHARIVEEMKRLDPTGSGPSPSAPASVGARSRAIPDGRSLHPGERNAALPAIRAALVETGFAVPAVDEADFYDDPTVAVVRRFQDEVGLVPDGVIGAGTRKALRRQDRDPLLMLRQTADQAGLPRKGRYLLVNIAAGLVTAIEDGTPVLNSRAVIGRRGDETETPTFAAQVTAVWVNPQWVVPMSIAIKEFGGEAHIEKPGPNNPLGSFLLEMPNGHAVFLHSTNEPRLFNMDLRAFSHGCVRVQEIESLARWLLGEARWAAEDIESSAAGLHSRRLTLDQPVPVYVQYRTATVASAGGLIFHPDPYHRADPPPTDDHGQTPGAPALSSQNASAGSAAGAAVTGRPAEIGTSAPPQNSTARAPLPD